MYTHYAHIIIKRKEHKEKVTLTVRIYRSRLCNLNKQNEYSLSLPKCQTSIQPYIMPSFINKRYAQFYQQKICTKPV